MRIAECGMRKILTNQRKSRQSVPMSGVQFRNPHFSYFDER